MDEELAEDEALPFAVIIFFALCVQSSDKPSSGAQRISGGVSNQNVNFGAANLHTISASCAQFTRNIGGKRLNSRQETKLCVKYHA